MLVSPRRQYSDKFRADRVISPVVMERRLLAIIAIAVVLAMSVTVDESFANEVMGGIAAAVEMPNSQKQDQQSSQCICDYYPTWSWILAWSPYDPDRPDTLYVGSTATAKYMTLYLCTSGSYSWSISESVPWLSFATSSGGLSGYCDEDPVTMDIDRDLLQTYGPGYYYGKVTLSGMPGGTYVFTVEALVVPPPGSNCSNPITISLPAALDYADLSQTTCGKGNSQSSTCLGAWDGGEDIHYRLNVSSPVTVDITLDPKGTTWVGMLLDDSCPADSLSCLYTTTNSGGAIQTIEGVYLAAGTYYIMIDTWPSPYCIPDFDLTIETHRVDPTMLVVPDEFATIQAALDASIDNDTIWINPSALPLLPAGNTGILIEKPLYVMSENIGTPYTTGVSGYAFKAHWNTSATAEPPHVRFYNLIIENFDTAIVVDGKATIGGCEFNYCGYGVHSRLTYYYKSQKSGMLTLEESDLPDRCLIDSCRFFSDTWGAWGAFRVSGSNFYSCAEGVSGDYSYVPARNYSVTSCSFSGGGGIAVVAAGWNTISWSSFYSCNWIAESNGSESWPNVLAFDNCDFAASDQGMRVHGFIDSLSLYRCGYRENAGAIQYDSRIGLGISYCTIIENTGSRVLDIATPSGGTVAISNTIIANNDGVGIYYPAPFANVSITCNDLYNNEQNYMGYPDQTGLNGNISLDPMLCSASGYFIADVSPCAPDNNSCGTYMGRSTVNCYTPVVSDIPGQTIENGETFASINLNAYVTDADNIDSELSWSYYGNDELTVNINASRVASITAPSADWIGSETITFRATDPDGLYDADAASFTVVEGNDAPQVSDIPDQTIPEGSSFTSISLDDYVVDPDNDDSEMTWTYSGNSALTVTISGGRVATIGIPDTNWNGSETITFRATDPGELFDEDAATFTVTAENDAPQVSDIPDQIIAEGGEFATISLDDYVTDPDNDDAEMTWTYSGNTELTVTISGSRVATIDTPDANWNGEETITFTAMDPDSLFDTDAATFTVTAENSPPEVADIPDQTVAEGESFATISLDDYVSDPDNDDSEMTWTYSGNTELTVTISGSRVATIGIPDEFWNGAETITFKATDPGSLSDTDSATFTVTAENDAPQVSGIPSQTIQEGSSFATISLDDYVFDPDNDDDEMSWTYSGNTELTVAISDTRVATIGIPSATWKGSETITFTATDPGSLSDSYAATFAVVTPYMLVVSPDSLHFEAIVGEVNPADQILHIDESESRMIVFALSESSNWINATPGSGTTPRDVTVSVDISALSAGTYADEIVVSSWQVATDVIVPVTLTLEDVTYLSVIDRYPQPGFEDFMIDDSVWVMFNVEVDAQSINETSFKVTANDQNIAGDYELSYDATEVTFYPHDMLPPSTVITIDLSGVRGANGETWFAGVDPAPVDVTSGIGVHCGDLDNDGAVTMDDVNSIALYWHATGVPRPPSYQNWRIWGMVPAETWSETPATYADADGNGVVDEMDLFPIGRHYGNQHEYSAAPSQNVIDPDRYQVQLEALSSAIQGYDTPFMQAVREHLARLLGSDVSRPREFTMSQNYPNPFNPHTVIKFYLPQSDFIELAVLNALGQRVCVLHNGFLPQGEHSFEWNGRNDNGGAVASGVYFYELIGNVYHGERKMVLLR